MKRIIICLLALLATMGLASCNEENDNQSSRKIIDIANREVDIPNEVKRVACIGSGTLRMYSYVADIKNICAVERVENYDQMNAKRTPLRLYYEKNKDYFHTLPLCGMGGRGETVPNAEELLVAQPDVIFSSHSIDAINTLYQQTKIPVVRVYYKTNDITDPALVKSLEIIGEVMHKEARASELINYLNSSISEIKAKTMNKESKPIYYGCNSHSGQRGILSTVAGYSAFDICNIKNIVDPLYADKKKPYYEHDFSLSKLLELNPEKIIIDGGGIILLKNELADGQTKDILPNIAAFKNGELYVQLPCNAYSTNIEMALINCYYCAYVAYPEIYSLDDVMNKVSEITLKFLDVDFKDLILERVPQGFKKLDLDSLR